MVLRAEREEWDGERGAVGRRFKRERIYVNLYLIILVVQQKLIYCKAIALQYNFPV